MKILVLGHREEETHIFKKLIQTFKYEISYTTDFLNISNVEITKGYDAIFITVSSVITEEVAKSLSELGVKYILNKLAGTDHLDLDAIHKYNLKVAYVPYYSPNAVSEHTVMLIISALRKLKSQLHRINHHNFNIKGLQGRELRNMTVGVIGTGRIGCATVKNLSGFGCQILVSSHSKKKEIKSIATYVPLKELLVKSDIIVFHCPLTDDTYHIINEETIKTLKNGVCLINTSRGGLLDTKAVMNALQTGKISAVAVDVYEEENKILRKDMSRRELEDKIFEEFIAMENVIYTTHTAFYTDEAVSNMIETTFENLHEYEISGCCKNEVPSS
ncbi:NAD(P)-dependent oxidoreductase [Clostridium sp. DL1XJH146]